MFLLHGTLPKDNLTRFLEKKCIDDTQVPIVYVNKSWEMEEKRAELLGLGLF
tara:strand:+ start:574 stop:729 length:156 start_codon:yes stop_codon:yes gene_type:complete